MSRWVIINKNNWINLDKVQVIKFSTPPPDTKLKYKIEMYMRNPIGSIVMEMKDENDFNQWKQYLGKTLGFGPDMNIPREQVKKVTPKVILGKEESDEN